MREVFFSLDGHLLALRGNEGQVRGLRGGSGDGFSGLPLSPRQRRNVPTQVQFRMLKKAVSIKAFFPGIALGVAIAFAWCYALAGPTYSAMDAGQPPPRAATSRDLSMVKGTADFSFCDSCFSVAATTAKLEHPTGAPPGDTATASAEIVLPRPSNALHTDRTRSVGGIALHRTSLFHQATLFRI